MKMFGLCLVSVIVLSVQIFNIEAQYCSDPISECDPPLLLQDLVDCTCSVGDTTLEYHCNIFGTAANCCPCTATSSSFVLAAAQTVGGVSVSTLTTEEFFALYQSDVNGFIDGMKK